MWTSCARLEGALEVFVRDDLQSARLNRFDLCNGPMTVSFEGYRHTETHTKVRRDQIGTVWSLGNGCDANPDQVVVGYKEGVIWCIVMMLLLIVRNAWPHPIDLSHYKYFHVESTRDGLSLRHKFVVDTVLASKQSFTLRPSQNNSFS